MEAEHRKNPRAEVLEWGSGHAGVQLTAYRTGIAVAGWMGAYGCCDSAFLTWADIDKLRADVQKSYAEVAR